MKIKFHIMKELFLVVEFICISISGASAQSKAHDDSKFAIIDPAYSANALLPKSNVNNNATTWIYGASELECWRLQLLQQRKDSAKLNVGYPGVFHKSFTEGSFRLKLKTAQKLNSIRFRVVGQGKVYVNNLLVGSFALSDSFQTIILNKNTKINQIQFDIATQNEPIALLRTPSMGKRLFANKIRKYYCEY